MDNSYYTDLAARLDAAPHNHRGEIITQAVALVGVTPQTLYRRLKKHAGWTSGRDRRSDHGEVKLTREQAFMLSSLLTKSQSKKGKNGLPMREAIEILRDSPGVEFPDISESHAARILRAEGLHPEQMARPTAAAEIVSAHPGHLVEGDVSVCRMYYIGDGGVRIIREEEFNRNKPENLQRIRYDRALRYVFVDHYSGTFKVFYIRGSGESAENMFIALSFFMQKQDGCPVHGVPWNLYWDMGAHHKARPLLNLLRGLGVSHRAHMPENARATGSVERMHLLIERSFEARLRALRVQGVEDLNRLAQSWRNAYCATRIHSRHGKTRDGLWQTIRQEHLRICPETKILQALMTTAPEERKIHPDYGGHIQFAPPGFGAQTYPLGKLLGDDRFKLRIGDKVRVCLSPYRAPEIFMVLESPDNGTDVFVSLAPRQVNEAGFTVGKPVFNSGDFSTPAFSETDKARQAIEMYATGATTQKAARAKQKKVSEPLFENTGIDPMADVKGANLPEYLDRPGVEVATDTPTVHRLIEYPEVFSRLAEHLERGADATEAAAIRARYPDGIPEAELMGVVDKLRMGIPLGGGAKTPQKSPSLKLVVNQ